MFKELDILSPAQVAELRQIAASANFVDGRISNPHSKVKQNLQLHDEAAYQPLLADRHAGDAGARGLPELRLPGGDAAADDDPLHADMRYGAHADAAFLQLGTSRSAPTSAATIFLNDPATYEGGALRIQLGTRDIASRARPEARSSTPPTCCTRSSR